MKKTYSTLANALTMVKADGGYQIFDVDLTQTEDNDTLKNWYDTYLKKYLVSTKVCYNSAGCWSYPIVQMNGSKLSTSNLYGIGAPCVTTVLNDGTLVSFDIAGAGGYLSSNAFESSHYGIIIYFDINGERKPNMIGKDVFMAVFTDKGLFPGFYGRTDSAISQECSKTGTGRSCIQKYLVQF